jgi:hypothetical protein
LLYLLRLVSADCFDQFIKAIFKAELVAIRIAAENNVAATSAEQAQTHFAQA